MANNPVSSVLRTAEASASNGSIVTTETGSSPLNLPSGTLRLRAEPVQRRHIQWAEDVIDNEGMGKKSSKGTRAYVLPGLSAPVARGRNRAPTPAKVSTRLTMLQQSAASTTSNASSASPLTSPHPTIHPRMTTQTASPTTVLRALPTAVAAAPTTTTTTATAAAARRRHGRGARTPTRRFRTTPRTRAAMKTEKVHVRSLRGFYE